VSVGRASILIGFFRQWWVPVGLKGSCLHSPHVEAAIPRRVCSSWSSALCIWRGESFQKVRLQCSPPISNTRLLVYSNLDRWLNKSICSKINIFRFIQALSGIH
jgi:hypothetical protein